MIPVLFLLDFLLSQRYVYFQCLGPRFCTAATGSF
jgi:hypothetical protein